MQVQFKNIYKTYPNFTAVSDLNLKIKPGALHFLLGPSGCGKTTTLRMLAGLEQASKGKILFNDKDVTKLAASQRGIGMVFQNYALWPHMTVYKNIEYAMHLKKIAVSERKQRIDDILQMTQLGRFIDRFPSQLSGGQQQRVALARALAIRPSILLLDEPLSNLDAKLRLEMRENLLKIHKELAITTLYVTHDQKEALSMATDVTIMNAGKEVQTGSPKDLYIRPKNAFVASFIGETNLIEGTFKGENNGQFLIETKLGLLFASLSAKDFSPKVNEKVCLSIRPESIQVLEENKIELKNVIQTEIKSEIYLGESKRLVCLHEKGQNFDVTLFDHHEQTNSTKNKTNLHLPSSKLCLLPQNNQSEERT